MDRKTIIIIASVSIVLIATGIGLGIYFYFNPLGASNQNLEEGTILLSGTLVEIDSGHWGKGTVQIVQFPDEIIEVQFVNVEIANGPDLYVYLSEKSAFSGLSDTPGTFYNLGELPYNEGNFSLDIPAEVIIEDYNSVLIWCEQFSVVFTYVSLA